MKKQSFINNYNESLAEMHGFTDKLLGLDSSDPFLLITKSKRVEFIMFAVYIDEKSIDEIDDNLEQINIYNEEIEKQIWMVNQEIELRNSVSYVKEIEDHSSWYKQSIV
jgi:hypothetical protein